MSNILHLHCESSSKRAALFQITEAHWQAAAKRHRAHPGKLKVTFGHDGNVTLDSFRERYDAELANDLGNLVSRTTAMIARYRDGVLAKTPGDGAFDASDLRRTIVEQFDRYDITNGADVREGLGRLSGGRVQTTTRARNANRS